MKVKDLTTKSGGLGLETNVGDLIKDMVPRIDSVTIPASILLYEGPLMSFREPRTTKRYMVLGKNFGPEDTELVRVNKQSIGVKLEYREPRELEQAYQDLKAIEEALGISLRDYVPSVHLDLSRFTEPWALMEQPHYSGKSPSESPAQENSAYVVIRGYVKSDTERNALDGIGGLLREHPDIISVEKKWEGELDEDAVLQLFEQIKKVDSDYGITYRRLGREGFKVKPQYRIDLSTGQPHKLEIVSGVNSFGPTLGLNMWVRREPVKEGEMPFFHLQYKQHC